MDTTSTTGVEHDVTDLLEPSRGGEPDTWGSPAVLTIPFAGDIPHRFGLGFVGPGGTCRRVYQGPVVPGPYAYAYGLATCIAADPEMSTGAEMRRARAAGMVIDANLGDVLVFHGHRFAIEQAPNRNVHLRLKDPTTKKAVDR